MMKKMRKNRITERDLVIAMACSCSCGACNCSCNNGCLNPGYDAQMSSGLTSAQRSSNTSSVSKSMGFVGL